MSKTGDHPILNRSDCCKMLQHWTVEGKIPRLISLSNGDILWCNPEFEDLVGYTLAEFHRGVTNWKKLTTNQIELETDEEMVRQILDGERRDYTLVKNYQTKTRGLVRVQLCVQRWPPDPSEEILFLCEVIPLIGHHPAACETTQHVLERLAGDVRRMRDHLSEVHVDVKSEKHRKTQMVDVVQWVIEQVQQHPKSAFSLAAVVLTLVLGEAGLALVMRVIKAINGVPPLPAGDIE